MAKNKNGVDPADISPELFQRIVEISALLWGGNRSKMARELGVDQPTISRVLSQEQKLSAKVLEKLAQHPTLDTGWLFLGQGEPISTLGIRPGVGRFRPLLGDLLPGPLADYEDRMSGMKYPVAAAFDTPTSYWFRVPGNAPMAKCSQYNVAPGDFLLMETDVIKIHRKANPAGKLCALHLQKGRKKILAYGWVNPASETYFDGYEQYPIDTFGEFGKLYLIIPEDDNAEAEARQAVKSEEYVSLHQIACMCIKLERSFVRT